MLSTVEGSLVTAVSFSSPKGSNAFHHVILLNSFAAQAAIMEARFRLGVRPLIFSQTKETATNPTLKYRAVRFRIIWDVACMI